MEAIAPSITNGRTRPGHVHAHAAGAASAVVLAGLLVKLAALAKEFVVAGVYGRSDAMDAFLIAFLVPNLLVNLIAESTNQALIPALVRVRMEAGCARARELFSGAVLWSCVLMGGCALALAIAARSFYPLLGSHFTAAKLELSIRIFRTLAPMVLFSGVAALGTAALNTLERFWLPALAPIVTPLVALAGTLLLYRSLGIWALVLASLVGTALHAALVLSMTQASAFALHLRWRASQRELAEVGRQAFPLLLSSLVASGGLLVDQAMAAMLPAGSVAALVFAGRFVSVALVLLGGAISSAITPYLSAMAAKQDWQACRDALRRWTRMSAAISLPIAVALMTGAHGLVRATLQHGAFGARDTAAVAPVLAMSALQIPFFVVSRVHYRLVIAMRRTDVVLWCGTINLILDVALNLLLMRWLGVAGIALATSLWTVSTWLFLWLWAKRLLERADRGGL